MNGDHRTPRRTLAGIVSLLAAGLFAAASVLAGLTAGAAPGTPAPEPAPGVPAPADAVEDRYGDLPDDGWLWDDGFYDGFDHRPAPGEEVAPFAATTADDPLNFLVEVFPAV